MLHKEWSLEGRLLRPSAHTQLVYSTSIQRGVYCLQYTGCVHKGQKICYKTYLDIFLYEQEDVTFIREMFVLLYKRRSEWLNGLL